MGFYNKYTLVILFSLFPMVIKAQWTKKDSLNLDRQLKSDREIDINRDQLKYINMNGGKFTNNPITPEVKRQLNFDETLPYIHKKLLLTIHPFVTAHYNWDPIDNNRVKVNDMWIPKIDKPNLEKRLSLLSNSITAKMMQWLREKGINNIPIFNTGLALRLNPLPNNGVIIPFVERNTGTYNHGGTISGDFMYIFEKRFWDRAGEKRRARTLEVLKHYNDTKPIEPIE
jgi:hypothetical protein